MLMRIMVAFVLFLVPTRMRADTMDRLLETEQCAFTELRLNFTMFYCFGDNFESTLQNYMLSTGRDRGVSSQRTIWDPDYRKAHLYGSRILGVLVEFPQ